MSNTDSTTEDYTAPYTEDRLLKQHKEDAQIVAYIASALTAIILALTLALLFTTGG